MPHSKTHWSERRKVIDSRTGCWLWTGAVNNNGYGKVNGTYAHRLAYIEARGTIPAGVEIDHLCRNRLCFNPDHLEAVTHRENMARSPHTGSETHCRHGHAYADTGFWLGQGGRKRCKECRRLRERPNFRPVPVQEIKRLRSGGMKAREIAAALSVSMRTVWRALA